MIKSASIESRLLPPFIPKGAKILMLGAFPPKREKWSMDFYYPNFINDMWRILGYILHGDKDFFVDTEAKSFKQSEIERTLISLGIAMGDTAQKVERLRDNASDKYLRVIQPIDLQHVMSQIPDCLAIVTTGEKASSVVAEITTTKIPELGKYVEVNVGENKVLRHYRMPSTSRAFPMKLDKKAEYYENMLREIGIL